MGGALIGRRAFLLGPAAALLAAGAARALGRIPVTGRLSFALPWSLERLDPHDAFDMVAAFFGHAAFDSAFALDSAGEPYPTLAAEMPTVVAGRTVLRLRAGLVTGRGRPIVARDVAYSIQRARGLGARPFWGDLPLPALDAREPLLLSFPGADAGRIARALAHPLVAVVPRSFDPRSPDGTGAMRAELTRGRLTLSRNPKAARGASYLESVTIDQASDLSASLRAFEALSADIGWLGAGLHAPRPGAVSFDAGSAGFVVLRTGTEAGAWSGPGIAQQILDGVAHERLAHLGLAPVLRDAAAAATEWGGPRCDLLHASGTAQLAEIAGVLATLMSRPGHEVAPRAVPADEIARRRSASTYALMLDAVRAPGGPGLPALIALTYAANPASAVDVARRPPKRTSLSPAVLARTLRLGVVGELHVTGATIPDVHIAKGIEGWDLGASFRVVPARRP